MPRLTRVESQVNTLKDQLLRVRQELEREQGELASQYESLTAAQAHPTGASATILVLALTVTLIYTAGRASEGVERALGRHPGKQRKGRLPSNCSLDSYPNPDRKDKKVAAAGILVTGILFK